MNHDPKTSTESEPPNDAHTQDPGGNQGEGNRMAARRYNEKTREFIDEGSVDPAARDARPATEKEADEMRDAERKGLRRAKH